MPLPIPLELPVMRATFPCNSFTWMRLPALRGTVGAWRIIAPTEPGPQPYNPGGEMVMWLSRDQGRNWTRLKQLTRNSPYNHTYARRPLHAHPQFYALWADGHARQPSESRLYFTDQEGTHVWRLPVKMDQPTAKPEPLVSGNK